MSFCVLATSPSVPKYCQWHVHISVGTWLHFPCYEWRYNAFIIPIFCRRCCLCCWLLQRLWVEDEVVDSPPVKVAKLNYAPSPSPSPLRNEKHVCIIDNHASPSKYSIPKGRRSTRCLCTNEPRIDIPTSSNILIVLLSTPMMFLKLKPTPPRPKCQLLAFSSFSLLVFVY